MLTALIHARTRIERRLGFAASIVKRIKSIRSAPGPIEQPDIEPDAKPGAESFEEVKGRFLRVILDGKIHDCPLCNRGGKIIQASLEFDDRDAFSFLVLDNEDGLKEQVLFKGLGGKRVVSPVLKRLMLFGLVERKRGGLLTATAVGHAFFRGEREIPASCFLLGGKSLGFSSEFISLAQLEESVCETPTSPVSVEPEVKPATSAGEE